MFNIACRKGGVCFTLRVGKEECVFSWKVKLMLIISRNNKSAVEICK